MYNVLIYILIIVSFLLVFFILLQPSKQQEMLSLLYSDKSSPLFENQKLVGIHHLLQCLTAFLGGLWFILSIVLVFFVE